MALQSSQTPLKVENEDPTETAVRREAQRADRVGVERWEVVDPVAARTVDHGDVVGVERMPQTKGVRKDPDPDSEDRVVSAQLVVLGRHDLEKAARTRARATTR